MQSILIAAADENEDELKIEEALAGYDVLKTHTILRAKCQMKAGPPIALFIIDVHFDDSRSIELAKIVCCDPDYCNAPIIMVSTVKTSRADAILASVGGMSKILKLGHYIELEGDSHGQAMLTDAVAKCILRRGNVRIE